MSDAVLDELGPVDFVIVEFPAGQSSFNGEMIAELVKLVDAGTIRVIDALILTKDADGEPATRVDLRARKGRRHQDERLRDGVGADANPNVAAAQWGPAQRRVNDAVAEANSSSHFAKRFTAGLVTGNADDVASLSGTVAGDLFVFGDIRDVVREGKHLAMGEDTDRLILGLAAAGLAVTAATYVSAGGVAPVRAGLTLVKDARKVGRLGEGLMEWTG